jgi:hypothetical protein
LKYYFGIKKQPGLLKQFEEEKLEADKEIGNNKVSPPSKGGESYFFPEFPN